MGEAIDNYVSTGGMVGAIASGLDTLLSTDDKKATSAVSSASSSNVSSGDSNTNASNVTTTGISSSNITTESSYGMDNSGGSASDADSLSGFSLESGLVKEKEYSTFSRFAKGGISREAAIFGEAGPEAAVPLPDGRSIPVTLDSGIEQAIERMALKVVTAVLSTTEAVKDAGRNATQSANRSQAVR